MAASARPRHDLVVVGASAGGVEALTRLVAHLPADLDAAVCVVLHVMPTGSSVLPSILARAGQLPAKHAEDGETPEPGTIYVAPPNSHLLVSDGTLRLDSGAQENGHRPAIDPLFRSAARSREHRVVGVILSGTLDDGTAGLRAVRIHGGATLVQDPEDALYSQMPQNAIAHGRPHYVLPVEELASMLARLVRGDVELQLVETVEEETVQEEDDEHHRIYTCPDCGGALAEVDEEGLVRFRCKVGHAYSQESLLHLQANQLEATLWAALRALEDRSDLTRRIGNRMRDRDREALAARYDRESRDAREHALALRALLETVDAIHADDVETEAVEQG